jgi:DNA-binding transcriptional MerR regulator
MKRHFLIFPSTLTLTTRFTPGFSSGSTVMLTIGKIASLTGISTNALRFYEREGLIHPVSKSGSGYRLYDDASATRHRFIQHAQHCGFTLVEIRELLTLREQDSACCSDVRRRRPRPIRDFLRPSGSSEHMTTAPLDSVLTCPHWPLPEMKSCPRMPASFFTNATTVKPSCGQKPATAAYIALTVRGNVLRCKCSKAAAADPCFKRLARRYR